MTKKQVYEIACEAVKIYFDYNISAKEAIKKAKEMIKDEKENEKKKAMETVN